MRPQRPECIEVVGSGAVEEQRRILADHNQAGRHILVVRRRAGRWVAVRRGPLCCSFFWVLVGVSETLGAGEGGEKEVRG